MFLLFRFSILVQISPLIAQWFLILSLSVSLSLSLSLWLFLPLFDLLFCFVQPSLLAGDLLSMAASHAKIKEKSYFGLMTEGDGCVFACKQWSRGDTH